MQQVSVRGVLLTFDNMDEITASLKKRLMLSSNKKILTVSGVIATVMEEVEKISAATNKSGGKLDKAALFKSIMSSFLDAVANNTIDLPIDSKIIESLKKAHDDGLTQDIANTIAVASKGGFSINDAIKFTCSTALSVLGKKIAK